MSDYRDVSVPAAPLRGVEELQGQLDRLAESTSAALRRVEQERDAALRFLTFRGQQITDLDQERDQLEAEVERLVDLGSRSMQERDLARAELASARQELDAVRTARDNLGRELAEARATIRALTRTGGTA